MKIIFLDFVQPNRFPKWTALPPYPILYMFWIFRLIFIHNQIFLLQMPSTRKHIHSRANEKISIFFYVTDKLLYNKQEMILKKLLKVLAY